MVSQVDVYIERLERREILNEAEIYDLCAKFKEIMGGESNVVRISSPITVVGDVHGQFTDVLEIFKIGGPVPYTNYLFLGKPLTEKIPACVFNHPLLNVFAFIFPALFIGDYVDRGNDSINTMALLMSLKVRFPNRVYLLRGNHESRVVTKGYGFYDECIKKYGSSNVWRLFTDAFDYLTIAATIDSSIFCVHGGLSPSALNIGEIYAINRFREVPHEGPFADMLWSDPDIHNDVKEFKKSLRGTGYLFGQDAVKRFLHNNNMSHVLRAHQLCMDGYNILFNDLLTTVWSAPNYCYRCKNIASILEVSPYLERFPNCFDAAPRIKNQSPRPNPREISGDYFL